MSQLDHRSITNIGHDSYVAHVNGLQADMGFKKSTFNENFILQLSLFS